MCVARSHTGSGEAAYSAGASLTMFLEWWLPASLLPQGWEECRDHLLCAFTPAGFDPGWSSLLMERPPGLVQEVVLGNLKLWF